MTLALPGLDALPPERLRSGALSQWFTPHDIAARMARWAGNVGGRVLEPSAGSGALVEAWTAEHEDPRIDAVEIDPDFAARLREDVSGGVVVSCEDYLTRPRPARRYDLALMNPPYEDGLDGLFLAKTMSECDRVIALVRLAALAGSGRHASVWSRIESHADGWHMPGLAVFSSRPVFDGPESASGSAKSDFVCVKLSRVSPPSETRVEWWT